MSPRFLACTARIEYFKSIHAFQSRASLVTRRLHSRIVEAANPWRAFRDLRDQGRMTIRS
jgi:hypothetical protein